MKIDFTKIRVNWVVRCKDTGQVFVTLNLYRTEDFTDSGILEPIRPATMDEVNSRMHGRVFIEEPLQG